MANIGILGDVVVGSSAGMVSVTKYQFIKINGTPIATVTSGDIVPPHLNHPGVIFLSVPDQSYIKINGDLIATTDTKASCGDELIGSGFVNIE